MSHRMLWFMMIELLAASGCQSGVALSMEGLTSVIESLRVHVSLDGAALPDSQVNQNLSRFYVQLPWEATGTLTISVDGLHGDGCWAMTGQTQLASGASSATITLMDREPQHLHVALGGSGKGDVIAVGRDGSMVDCNPECNEDLPVCTQVQLTATLGDANSAFGGWSDVCSANLNCIFRIDENLTIEAQFVSCQTNASHFCKQPFAPPMGLTITKLFGFSPTDLWAIGASGAILHWYGEGWAQLPVVIHSNLLDIWGPNSSDIWIVGYDSTVLHTDGGMVSPAGGLISRSIGGVWGTNPTWLASSNGIWKGPSTGPDAGWQQFKLAQSNYTAVWGSSPDNIWFVGGTGYFHMQGLTLAQGTLPLDVNPQDPNHGTTLQGDIWGTDYQHIWVVGSSNSKPALAALMNEKSYMTIDASMVTGMAFTAIWGSSPDDLWLLTDLGDVWHLTNGSVWTDVGGRELSGPKFVSLWGTGPNQVFTIDSSGNLYFYRP